MTYLKINPRDIAPAIIRTIAGSLKKGSVVVLPTDTIYGFSCVADNSRALARIYQLKKRPAAKPFIVLVSSLAMAKRFVFISRRQEAFLKETWTAGVRPTTIILRHRHRLPAMVSGDSDGLAIRLPKNDFLIKIVTYLKKPLTSTSLNLSGEADISDLSLLGRYWPDKAVQPDLIVDAGRPGRRRASRLVDLRSGKPQVLRR